MTTDANAFYQASLNNRAADIMCMATQLAHVLYGTNF